MIILNFANYQVGFLGNSIKYQVAIVLGQVMFYVVDRPVCDKPLSIATFGDSTSYFWTFNFETVS